MSTRTKKAPTPLPIAPAPSRITVDLDPDLYRALRLATAHTGETIRDVATEGIEIALRKRQGKLPFPLPWPKK